MEGVCESSGGVRVSHHTTVQPPSPLPLHSDMYPVHLLDNNCRSGRGAPHPLPSVSPQEKQMHILHILTKLRKDMAETEHAITQAWQRYSKELSTKALAEAEATTKRLAALHRRLASRLEQIAGEGRRRWGARTLRPPQTPPDAPPPRQTPRRSA